MSLEIPVEKRLIRKLEVVGYFLYVKSVDFQQYFYFEYDMFINDVFCCFSGDGLRDGG